VTIAIATVKFRKTDDQIEKERRPDNEKAALYAQGRLLVGICKGKGASPSLDKKTNQHPERTSSAPG
jgi:hypothetical protein